MQQVIAQIHMSLRNLAWSP